MHAWAVHASGVAWYAADENAAEQVDAEEDEVEDDAAVLRWGEEGEPGSPVGTEAGAEAATAKAPSAKPVKVGITHLSGSPMYC